MIKIILRFPHMLFIALFYYNNKQRTQRRWQWQQQEQPNPSKIVALNIRTHPTCTSTKIRILIVSYTVWLLLVFILFYFFAFVGPAHTEIVFRIFSTHNFSDNPNSPKQSFCLNAMRVLSTHPFGM